MGTHNPRPLVGRTAYSRINFDVLDPIVRPASSFSSRRLLQAFIDISEYALLSFSGKGE